MSSLPRVTAELPGSGGALKTVPEDFIVEEVPAYLPTGAGPHLYLFVEKRGVDTPTVARALAQAAGVPEQEVGYAGLKDRQAVTRQWFSVPERGAAALETFTLEGVTVKERSRHANKLRTGHLRGNRFTLRLRSVRSFEAIERKLEALVARGVPNYFGEQRFGRGEDNATFGKRLLLGERLPGRLSGFQRKLYLSAYQSSLFNALLAERVEQGTLGRALLGDVLQKRETGGSFVCADPAVDQPRVDAFEVSPAGPMFGPKLVPAEAEVGAREARMLVEEGLTVQHFARQRGEAEGTRRAYRLMLEAPAVERDGEDAVLAFTLPRGSYATVVLDEVMGD